MKVEFRPQGCGLHPTIMELSDYIDSQVLLVRYGVTPTMRANRQQDRIREFLGRLTDILACEGVLDRGDLVYLSDGLCNPPAKLMHSAIIKKRLPLESCPFCGGQPTSVGYTELTSCWQVQCPVCGCCSQYSDDSEMGAAVNWNTRRSG